MHPDFRPFCQEHTTLFSLREDAGRQWWLLAPLTLPQEFVHDSSRKETRESYLEPFEVIVPDDDSSAVQKPVSIVNLVFENCMRVAQGIDACCCFLRRPVER